MHSELTSACHAALSAIMCAARRLGCSASIIAVLATEKADVRFGPNTRHDAQGSSQLIQQIGTQRRRGFWQHASLPACSPVMGAYAYDFVPHLGGTGTSHRSWGWDSHSDSLTGNIGRPRGDSPK